MRAFFVVAVLAFATSAVADPDNEHLVLTGLALTPPTYVLGVAMHEGSHALAAKLVGANVTGFTLIPGDDPRTGAFHFGRTDVDHLFGRGNQIFFYVAPKITDLVMLGGFATLLAADWPSNRYAELSLTVLATGFWVDFSKDVFSRNPNNDIVKVLNLVGLDTECDRLPVRILYLAADAALGYLVWRGYERTFDRSGTGATSMRVLPIVVVPF